MSTSVWTEGASFAAKSRSGADKKPAAKQTITLSEQGVGLSADNPYERVRLDRSTETDSEGRYSIRVGPGRYGLHGPNLQNGEEITLEAEQTTERDFHLDELPWSVFKGVVLADAFDGKPVRGAVLQWNEVFCNSIADDRGRFEFRRLRREKMFMYARNPEGTMATIAPIGAEEDEAKIVLSAAGKIYGRLVDKAGKAIVGVRVQCFLKIGPDDNPHARAHLITETDDAGGFAFSGIVAGSKCSVFASTDEGSQTLRRLPLVQTESIDLGELTFDPEPY